MKDRRTEGFYLIYRALLLGLISWTLVLFPYLIFDVLGFITVFDERLGIVARFMFALVNVFQVLVSMTMINGVAAISGFYPRFRGMLRLVLLRLGIGTIAALAESTVIAIGNADTGSQWGIRHIGNLEFGFRIVNLVSYYLVSFFIMLSFLYCLSEVLYDYGAEPGEDEVLGNYRSRVIIYSLLPIIWLGGVLLFTHNAKVNLHQALDILGGKSEGRIGQAVGLCILWLSLFLSTLVRIRYQFTIMKKCKEVAVRIESISG